MTTLKTSALIAAIIAGLTVTAANAAPGGKMGGHGPMPSFAELDANGDGTLTAEELAAHKDKMFADADTNGDGALSADELAAASEARRAKAMVSRLDKNGDGQLQADEMRPASRDGKTMFDRLDADDDGSISAEEFDAMAKRGDGRGHRRGHGDRDCGDRGKRHGG